MKLYIDLRRIYVSKGTFQCLYMITRSESLAPSPYLEDINIVNKNELVYTKLSDCMYWSVAWHKQFQLPKLCSVLNRASIPHYPNIAPCKGVQDSLEFWIPRRKFRILCQWNFDSGFISLEFRFLELYYGFQSPGFRIPQSKNFPDSLARNENCKVKAGSRSFKTKTISTLYCVGLEVGTKTIPDRASFHT